MMVLAPLDARERETLVVLLSELPIILTRFGFHCAAAFPYAVANT
jgi:hypothetical protein